MIARPKAPQILGSSFYGGVAALSCAPLFELPHGLGVNDWDQHLFYYGAVLKSVVEYGVPPFWNPWYCGGNVLWQNPQVALLSPAYPLATLTSLALAMKINILLHYWIGFIGMHLVLRRVFGISSRAVVAYLACVFTLSGAHAMHLAVGHSVFLPGFYLPLQVFFFLRAVQTGMMRHVLAAGGLLALMVYNGSLHLVPMSIASIAFFALLASLLGRRWRPVVLAAVMVGAGLAYAAPKFLPVTLFATGDRLHDTRDLQPDRMSAEMILHAYVAPYQHRGLQFDGQRYGWHEYGNYTGALFALLFASSIVWIVAYPDTRERWLGLSLGGTSLFLLAVSAGEFGLLAPSSLATHLPLFSNFRVPSRYTIPFVLFGVMTAAWVWRQLEADQLNRRVRSFVIIVCVLAAGDLLMQTRAQFEDVFSQSPLRQTFRPFGGPDAISIDRDSNPYGPNSPMFRALMNDQSFYRCYESLQLVHTADADHPLIFTDGGSTIFETIFSPNRIEFTVLGGTEPSSVFLNQNYDPGWRSSLAPVTLDAEDNKPAATIAAGQAGRFSFTFVPDGLGVGTMLLVMAITGSVWAWKRHLPI